MSNEPKQPLADIQSSPDVRNIPIDRVGVRNVEYPMALLDRARGLQHTIGVFSLTVDLPHQFKGTHMSRFLEVLSDHREEVGVESIGTILATLRERLNADTAHLDVRFKYFRKKAAPVTGKEAMMGYECAFYATGGAVEDFVIEVQVPVTTLCPCSKEISARGAHNQRGLVTARVRFEGELWLEELIDAIEACASCDLYPVLKRPDEKWVTEKAYDTPRFVEDMVREVALSFEQEQRITWFEIEVENFESIHAHNAYAKLERNKR
ncbi:MAG: GTP cyclohydrolase FolE2 [Fimbriimonadaceae bacterium]|nr:GTP cyclohydrolase FolE2 [Fimbriimonadaceae bacterium]